MSFDRVVKGLRARVKNRFPLVAEYLSTKRDAMLARALERRYPVVSKKSFLCDLRDAVLDHRGYAAAKIGFSQQYWMYYEIALGKLRGEQLTKFEKQLHFHAMDQEGIFPRDLKFYLRFNEFYMEHVRNLDCLGVCYRPWELEILKHYSLRNQFIHYPLQEPDRSIPASESNCYLQNFRDKKVLIICPFGHLLRARATKEIFEDVWSKTGKKWFYPQSVDSIEFPYGFSTDTHKRYGTVFDLFESITDQIQNKSFDVALIAAGALSIPICSHIKSLGKISIDLGGHLQVLFGVIGKRWRESDEWRNNYFNEAWIDMPLEYKPKEAHEVCDHGAYW